MISFILNYLCDILFTKKQKKKTLTCHSKFPISYYLSHIPFAAFSFSMCCVYTQCSIRWKAKSIEYILCVCVYVVNTIVMITVALFQQNPFPFAQSVYDDGVVCYKQKITKKVTRKRNRPSRWNRTVYRLYLLYMICIHNTFNSHLVIKQFKCIFENKLI